MASSMEHEALPADTDSRIAGFTELVATAISNTEARTEVRRLADEQAALRRVATLVARGVPPGELFDAVTKEVGTLLGADLAGMIRYLTGRTLTAVATWSAEGEHPEVRGVWPLDGDRLATTIKATSRPAREDDWAGAAGPIAVFVREELGVRSSVGSPIVVEGEVWGALFVHSKQTRHLPAGTESRLAEFTELVATAISNTQARAEVRRLADEQTALRRVATLVAHEASPVGGLRRGRGGARAPAGRRRRAAGPLRRGRDGHGGGEVGPTRQCRARRHPAPAWRPERHQPGRAERRAGPDGRLQRGGRCDLGVRPQAGGAIRGGRPDRRRGAPVGSDGRHLAGGRCDAGRHGGVDRGVRRADRDRDREHPGAVGARRVARTRGRRRRRRAPARGPRSARRRAAAAGPHGDHAEAGTPGARESRRHGARARGRGARAGRGCDG